MEGNRHGERRDSTSPATAALPALVRLGEGDFHARLTSAAGVAAVLFTAPHCGACRVWKRLLPEALAGIADALYEVDVSEATGVARYYGIYHLPAIYLYRDGHFHAELQCEAKAGVVQETASSLLAGEAGEEP